MSDSRIPKTEQGFRPTWRTPHTVRLKPSDAYSTSSGDSPFANNTSRHRPLGNTYWAGGRRAGTYGNSSAGNYQHPDDVDDNDQDEGGNGLQDRKKEWDRTREEIDAKGGVEAILKDPSTVLTVRDVKKAVPK